MTWYVVDRDEYLASLGALGAAYREVIGRHYPAMTAVQASLANIAGQGCVLPTRLLVHEAVYDDVADKVVAMAAALHVGRPFEAGVQMGPVVDKSQLNQDLFYIEEGKKEGARLAFGGSQLKRETEGFYLEPALFTDTRNDMRIK